MNTPLPALFVRPDRYEIQRAQNNRDTHCWDVIDLQAHRPNARVIADAQPWKSAAKIADALNLKVASHVR